MDTREENIQAQGTAHPLTQDSAWSVQGSSISLITRAPREA